MKICQNCMGTGIDHDKDGKEIICGTCGGGGLILREENNENNEEEEEK